jgi:TonB family protein
LLVAAWVIGDLVFDVDIFSSRLSSFELLTEEFDKVDSCSEAHCLAEFKYSVEGLYFFIESETNYPNDALDNDIEGEVTVQFWISEKGTIDEPEVVSQKIGFGLEEEAIRVLEATSGLWYAGKVDGKAIRSKFRIPLKFKIY